MPVPTTRPAALVQLARPAPVALLAVAILAGCGRPEWVADLTPLPEIDLGTFETVVQEQIAGAVERVGEAQQAGDRARAATAYGELGAILQTYELYDAATTSLENAIQLEPAAARWSYYLAIVQQTTGDLPRAAERLTRAVELSPEYLPARVRLGEIWIASQRPERARDALEGALELDPDCALAHYFLGQAALAMGESEESIQHLERSLALQPQATAVHHLLAQAYRGKGDLEQAQWHLERLDEGGAEVVKIRDPLFLELGALDVGAAARVRRGARAQVAGDYETALDEYRQAVAADPENPEARQSLGGVLLRKGENRAAIEQYRAALRLIGDDPLVLSNLGAVLMAVGERAEALQLLERAIELDPALPNARLALGALLTDEGRSREALTHYRLVLERDRDNADALLGLAQALAAQGDGADAVAALQAALESNAPPQTLARVHAELGSILSRRGDSSAALAQLGAAVELDPRLASARFAKANLLGALGRYRPAGEEYSELIRQVPASVPARLGGATAWALAGDYAKARDSLVEGVGETTDPKLDHALARLLVTAPEEGVRDVVRGLELAEDVHQRMATMETSETLALALAASGRCTAAVERERALLDRARSAGDRGLGARITNRLDHFQSTGSCLPPWVG